MSKERELDEIKAEQDLQSELWKYAELIRSIHNFANDDFHIIFLLISLYRDDLIDVSRRDYSHEELLNIISKDTFYSRISNFYKRKLFIFELGEINSILEYISGFRSEEFKSNFEDLFEIFLKLSTDQQSRSAGNSLLQSELAGFMNQLAGLGEYTKVFNPFSGYATFGIHLLKEQYYLAHEINETIWVISLLRLKAHNRHENQDVLYADTFDKWPQTNNWDLVIANPPFGLRLPRQTDSPHKTVEQFVFLEGLKLLNPKGKLITTVPLRFLHDQRERETIKYLIDQDIVEAVITFPGGLLMHTQIPFAIILINKNKKIKNQVAFFHGSEFVTELGRGRLIFNPAGLLEEMDQVLNPLNYVDDKPDLSYIPDWYLKPKLIANEKIIDNNFSLDINRYMLIEEEGTPIVELILPVEPLTASTVNDQDDIEVPFLSTKDLKNDYKDFIIEIDSLPSKKLKKGRFISQDVFLVSLSGKSLKPSFLKRNEGDSFVLSNDLFAFLVDEKRVDPRWLIKELSSDSIKDKLNLLSYGVIPRIKKEDFLNLKIKLPSLKEQQEEIKRLLNLEKQVDDLESDIIEQNSYLRHSVAGPLSDLDHALTSIDYILRNISINIMPEILKEKISKDHIYNLGEYLNDAKEYVAVINDTVTNKLSASQNIERKRMEQLDLFAHFENYVARKNEAKNTKDYRINFDYDGDFFNNKLNNEYKYVFGNAELIDALLDNMVDNAIKHAFTEGEKNHLELYVWVDDDGKQFCFSVSNTGKSLPEGSKLKDLKRKGYRKGPNNGDGFGLWYVNEVVRKHNAEWYLINELWDEYPLKKDSDSSLLTFKNTQYNIKVDRIHYVTKFSFHFPIYKK